MNQFSREKGCFVSVKSTDRHTNGNAEKMWLSNIYIPLFPKFNANCGPFFLGASGNRRGGDLEEEEGTGGSARACCVEGREGL